MVQAGRLTRSQLVEVEPGVFLGIRAARAYRRAKVAFRRRGKSFGPVNRFSGYRDKEIQNGMADASRSPKHSAARARYNLSSTSTVPIAYDPNGSHQTGRAIDFLINGSSAYPSESDRKLLAKFGWRFQFGSDDPNHIRHNNLQGATPLTKKWLQAHRIWTR